MKLNLFLNPSNNKRCIKDSMPMAFQGLNGQWPLQHIKLFKSEKSHDKVSLTDTV